MIFKKDMLDQNTFEITILKSKANFMNQDKLALAISGLRRSSGCVCLKRCLLTQVTVKKLELLY